MNHLTKGCPPFTVEQKGKIPKEYLKEAPNAKKEKEDPSAKKEKEDPSAENEKEDSSARKEDCSAQKEKDPSAQKEKDLSIKKEEEKQKRIQIQIQKQKQDDRSELVLYIHDNELIKGIIDKAQFGKYGIVHTVHELYGADTAGILLSTFSRLFTLFLQVNLQITLPFSFNNCG